MKRYFAPENAATVSSTLDHDKCKKQATYSNYITNKINKLSEQFNYHQKNEIYNNSIFKDCNVFVNGLTDPPIEEIKRLVIKYGGNFHNYKIHTTTHIVCEHYPPAKIKDIITTIRFLARKKDTTKKLYFVTAKWVTDSIKNGKRMNEFMYLLDELKENSGVKISDCFKQNNNSDKNDYDQFSSIEKNEIKINDNNKIVDNVTNIKKVDETIFDHLTAEQVI